MGMKNGSFGYAMALTVVTSIFTVGLSVISQTLINKNREKET